MILKASLKNKLAIICGPTASGKTYIAEKIALANNMEIISADSMQIYMDMDIGTAKEKALKVKQHMIDIIKPNEEYNVFMYQKAVNEILNNPNNTSKKYVVCGGTGLYIDSLYYKMNFGHGFEKDDLELKSRLDKALKDFGKQYVYNMLVQSDPEAAMELHPNNSRRVLRALYLVMLHNKPLSQLQKKEINEGVKIIILQTNREKLRLRVESRVDKMLKMGLLDEVNMLINKYDLTFQCQSLNGIGYKEWEPYFCGKASVESIRDAIITNTMRYAKRQVTWFNNQYKDNVIKVDTTLIHANENQILKQISDFIM